MNSMLRRGVLATWWGVAAAMAGPDDGLVAHYTFEQDAGKSVMDSSGQGNAGAVQGGAARVEGTYGAALALDGKDAYVDCGKAASLDIAKAGTVMLWVCPRALEGGLIDWSTGGGWADERLVLAFNTYSGGNRLITALADGRGYVSREWPGGLEAGQWYHLAFSFDGSEVRFLASGGVVKSVKAKGGKDKPLPFDEFFHHRVPAVFNNDGIIFIDQGFCISVFRCRKGKTLEGIHDGNEFCCFQDQEGV